MVIVALNVGSVSLFISCVPLYHDTSDRGLLTISRVNITLSPSFTLVLFPFDIFGSTKLKKQENDIEKKN